MTNFFKLFLYSILIFISISTTENQIYSQFIIQGNIYYTDNYTPVLNDMVYILKYDNNLCLAYYLDSASIDINGNYQINISFNDSVLICVGNWKRIQNEDHVTTYYQSTIDWTQAQPIYPPDNPININIAVQRIVSSPDSASISGTITTTDSNNNQIPVGGATVVAQQDTTFTSAAITDANGNYTLDSLATGAATIYATKIGYGLDSSAIIIGGNRFNHTNLILKKSKFKHSSFVKRELIGVVNKSFSLSQNYPNPFNPVTKIKFSIPLYKVGQGDELSKRNIKLIIYDILGREVATIVNEKLQPGSYEIFWDATKFSSGIYFYELKTDELREVKRMILIK